MFPSSGRRAVALQYRPVVVSPITRRGKHIAPPGRRQESPRGQHPVLDQFPLGLAAITVDLDEGVTTRNPLDLTPCRQAVLADAIEKIGRASSRESICQ